MEVWCDQSDPNGSNQADLYYSITFLRGGKWCDQRLLPIPYVPASVFPNGQRTQTTNVQLIQPGTKYLDRWNQVDVSVKKSFRVGKITYSTQVDLYNALNSSVVITRTSTYGAAFDFQTAILHARLMRLVAQIKWQGKSEK